MTSAPLADIVAEAERLVAMMTTADVGARLIGGLGVAAHDHRPVPQALVREFADIDIVVPRKAGRATSQALIGLGYSPNTRFNALHGSRRLLFYDTDNRRQLDVFVGDFSMCHQLDLGGRLVQHPRALTAADLLLTKLQIVELNRKDILDTARLLLSHEVTDDEAGTVPGEDGLSITRVLSITTRDWGWHTTLSDNLDKVARALPDGLTDGDAALVVQRTQALIAPMNSAPKSARWKARSVVGRRRPWYELPEEVAAVAKPSDGTKKDERTARG